AVPPANEAKGGMEKDKLSKSGKKSKDEKKVGKKESKENGNKNVKSDVKGTQNSAFMSELYESFRLKAQKEGGKEHKSPVNNPDSSKANKENKSKGGSGSTKSSFLFKR